MSDCFYSEKLENRLYKVNYKKVKIFYNLLSKKINTTKPYHSLEVYCSKQFFNKESAWKKIHLQMLRSMNDYPKKIKFYYYDYDNDPINYVRILMSANSEEKLLEIFSEAKVEIMKVLI
jgi:hypothetical protein